MRDGIGNGHTIGDANVQCFSHGDLRCVHRDQFTVRGRWIHLHNPSSDLVDDTRVDTD